MRGLTRMLGAAALLAASTAGGLAQDRTEISVSRFFGACEADYGAVTDVAKANGECGIITALINKFNAQSKTTHVKVDIVEWPGYDQLTARIRSGEPPTISVMHEAVISDYSSRGLLEPLDEGFKAAGIDAADFTAAARDGVTKDGKIYALPFDTHTWLWHINLNLFKQAGLVDTAGKPILPKSADELLQQAAQFKDKTGKPYFVSTLANEQAFYTRTFDTLLYQQNAEFFADPAKVDFATPEAKAALTLLKTIFDKDLTTKNQDYAASVAAFSAGEGGVFICGTWLIDSYDQESKKATSALHAGYDVVPFPQLYPGSPRVWADGHSWVILKADLSDAQRKSAYEFLKFLWDNDFEWARTGHLPTRTSVADSAAFKALPFRAGLLPLTRNGTALPAAVKRQFSVQDIEGEEIGAAMRGDKDIDAALNDAQSRINEMLATSK
ncbi:extracellular solute-binding protein [Labrys wisconsinensis]|uniref:Multiple sugar transport system substrate-binding protein n=1 Tax=Labrys wisconsinensis TaxID=425677 RepID=A0ABU0JFG0_9HYPH|nr:extracellular solute-binding protein [Labrys wisconsinensis]MDQ0472153.1 multiple sugar transport system substrate-binding protein [Labrys wisconsinensis]